MSWWMAQNAAKASSGKFNFAPTAAGLICASRCDEGDVDAGVSSRLARVTRVVRQHVVRRRASQSDVLSVEALETMLEAASWDHPRLSEAETEERIQQVTEAIEARLKLWNAVQELLNVTEETTAATPPTSDLEESSMRLGTSPRPDEPELPPFVEADASVVFSKLQGPTTGWTGLQNREFETG